MTVTSGAAASVSFTNKLNTGGVKLVKTTNTGENLGGWQIGLYTDSACTSPVTGSPFTTGEDGTVTVTGLLPGALYAKEIAGSDPYWECDTAVKTVTVAANLNLLKHPQWAGQDYQIIVGWGQCGRLGI